MCRWEKPLQGGSVVALLALAGLVFASVAHGASAQNGPGGPPVGFLALGDLAATSPESCSVAYTLQVVTDAGGGNDDFELQVFDDGAMVQSVALSAPADGAQHQLAGSFRLDRPVSQQIPGVGVYLVDSGVILDAVDPLAVPCGFVEIPTLDTAGAWILGGLLLASALVVLRRPRRAA